MKKILFWLLSFIITISFAYFQRKTGPTYPIKNTINYKDVSLNYYLPRSCTIGKNDCVIKVTLPPAYGAQAPSIEYASQVGGRVKSDKEIEGVLIWRRYKTADKWSFLRMNYVDKELSASIADQPPAGKIEYKIEVGNKDNKLLIPKSPVITRFKGFVPAHILVPHIIFMFLFMLFSVRIFFGIMDKKYPLKHPVFFNIFFLALGGFIFGPITQKYAFGFLWTGFPFGHDLTDNKALIMMIFWLIAAVSMYKAKYPRRWITVAFVVTFAMYLIPHSVLGSEFDYNKRDRSQKQEVRSQKQLDLSTLFISEEKQSVGAEVTLRLSDS